MKEVIARGVTLRRAALWRKIRSGEPKPLTVSDRSWRTLGRQLNSPATIEKAESCRKANASRMNFGRTGPSGEVGVRQRLRRALRRSPDPEEIEQEMARDKGYGGFQRERKNDNVMHGSEGPIQLYVEGKQHSGRSGLLEVRVRGAAIELGRGSQVEVGCSTSRGRGFWRIVGGLGGALGDGRNQGFEGRALGDSQRHQQKVVAGDCSTQGAQGQSGFEGGGGLAPTHGHQQQQATAIHCNSEGGRRQLGVADGGFGVFSCGLHQQQSGEREEAR